MKKLLLTIGLAGCIALNINAQTNLNLEAWSPVGIGAENPDGWGSLNEFTFFGFPQSTFKETADPGEGLASARLETAYMPGATGSGAVSDTVGGMLFLGIFNISTFTSGIAYTQKPVSVDFIYKANPLGTDTGAVQVILSHWDGAQTVIDGTGLMLFPNQVTTWTPASIPISYVTADIPDTLKIIAASSAIMLGLAQRGMEVPGSQLFLDSFALVLPPPPPCGIDSSQIAVIIETGDFGNEVSWSITNATGAQVDTGFGYANTTTYYDTLCIKNCELYDFNMYDSFGDGWNGGIYTIVLVSTGDTLSSGGLLGGSFGSDPFRYCDLPDAGITSVLSPISGCSLTASETVEVVIQNYSSVDTINTIVVSYRVDGGLIVTDIVISTILPGNSLNYVFSAPADLSAPGLHTIDAWTDLLSDNDNTNDSLNGYVVNNITPLLSFNDSIYITNIIPAGIQATICTNGLVANMLDTCYQLTAVVIDSLSHTWTSDLDIYLISPNNDTLELSTDNGGSGDNYYNVIFTDTALINISTITSGGFGAGGYYHTEDPAGLASFTGFDPNGAWNLWITDDASGDDGAIYKWHLEFTDTTLNAGTPGTLDICDTETAIDLFTGLGGTPDGSGSWNDDDTTGALTGGMFDASLAGTGVYNFTYIIIIGCVDDSATVTVTVNPAYNDSANASICTGDSIFLEGAYQFAPGVYVDTLPSVDGCDSVVTTTLVVNPLPTVNIGADTSICSGDSLILDAANPGSTYLWNTGATTQTDTVNTTGWYSVNVTDINGCSKLDSINVLVITTLVVDLGADITMCDGEVAMLDAGISGADSYLWNTGESTQTITTDTAGMYIVEVNKCGTDTDTIIVIVNPTYSVNVPDTICDNDSLQLPGGAYVNTAGIYYDTLTAVNGCDSVIITDLVITTSPNAGIDSTANVCDTELTFNLSTGLGGTPDGGGSWNDDDGSGALIPFTSSISPAIAGAGVFNFTYVVAGTAPCANDSATVTVIITAPPAGTDGSLSACVLETNLDLTTGLSGIIDSTGTWNDDDATGELTGSIFDPSAVSPGVYNFTYTVAWTSGCTDTTATVTVTVVPTPNAGGDGSLTACSSDLTLDVSTGLVGAFDAGGTWNDDDGSGAIFIGNSFTPALVGAGTFNYTYVVSASGCADDSATVTVNISASPNAGTGDTLDVCDTVTVDLTTGLDGTQDAGGTWLDDDATGALTGGVFNPAALGANTYNFTYVVSASGCADDSATVSVTVSICTGISEISSSVSVNIYPNPNKGQFIVEITNTKKEETLIEVRNIIGQLIFSEQIDDISGNFTKEIDLSGHKGVYFLSISNSSGTRTEKLIVY